MQPADRAARAHRTVFHARCPPNRRSRGLAVNRGEDEVVAGAGAVERHPGKLLVDTVDAERLREVRVAGLVSARRARGEGQGAREQVRP